MADQFTEDEIKRFEMRLAQEKAQNAAMTHYRAPTKFGDKLEGVHMFTMGKDGEVAEVPALMRFGAGIGSGMQDIARNVGNLIGLTPDTALTQALPENVSYPQTKSQSNALARAMLAQDPYGKVGRFIGETVASLPVGEGFAAGAEALPLTRAMMQSKTGLSKISRGALEGATQGAVVAGPEDRKTGAFFGALGGGAVPALGKVFDFVSHGMERTPAARALQRQGVELTPGQANPGGTWSMLEESTQNLPFVGPRVKTARERGWQQTQALIGNEAAPPGYTPPARADIKDTYNDLKDAYENAYDNFKNHSIVPVLVRNQGGNVPLSKFMTVTGAADKNSAEYVQNFVNNELSRIKNQPLTSGDLLNIRSNIRTKMRDMANSDTYPDVANLFKNAEQKITQVLESQLPADVMQDLKAVDAKYGNFKVLEDAIVRAKDRPEAFTPAQLSMAVKQSAGTPGQYASGGGRMRNISQASTDVFSPRVPMTGAQQPSQLVGLASAMPINVFYGQGKPGQLARALLMGQTGAQEKIRDIERAFRRTLSPAERETIARLLGTISAVGTEEKRPFFATTAE